METEPSRLMQFRTDPGEGSQLPIAACILQAQTACLTKHLKYQDVTQMMRRTESKELTSSMLTHKFDLPTHIQYCTPVSVMYKDYMSVQGQVTNELAWEN